MRPALTEKDTIVLVDFTNQTGGPLFDGALRQGLSFELEQAPFAVLHDGPHPRSTADPARLR
jgi:hypothetical protein